MYWELIFGYMSDIVVFEILEKLFKKYEAEPWVLNGKEIRKKTNSFFSSTKWIQSKVWNGDATPVYATIGGLLLRKNPGSIRFLLDNPDTYVDINVAFHASLPGPPDMGFHILKDNEIKCGPEQFSLSAREIAFLEEFRSKCVEHKEKIRLKSKKTELLEKEQTKSKIEKLKSKQLEYLKELDKDDNGTIDAIEGVKEFDQLYKKHQKKLIEFDRNQIKNFVRISNYLQSMRENLQDFFLKVKTFDVARDLHNDWQLDMMVDLLKNQIHTYEVTLFHSLNMVICAINDDVITFYEIFETFDKVGIFNSQFEKNMIDALNNIDNKLGEVMNEINRFQNALVDKLNELNYTNEIGFKNLQNSINHELQGINSSLSYNNLLTTISTYQLYKINKQTKGLIN